MKIEWNKVTWYSKALALALFVALPFLGFYLGIRYEKLSIEQASLAPLQDSKALITATSPNFTRATLQGQYVCLPPLVKTEGCTLGLKTGAGAYYGLNFALFEPGPVAYQQLKAGDRISVEGPLFTDPQFFKDEAAKYDIQGMLWPTSLQTN